MAYTRDPRTWKVEVGELEVQGHLQLHGRSEATLGVITHCLKKTTTTKIKKKTKILVHWGIHTYKRRRKK